VASRTEIDWAMRRGQAVVWAPSKLVLDTPNGPKGADPVSLTLWLAETLQASRVLVAGGGPLPAHSTLVVSRL
jgi:7,8-dihydroneopterin aldolase/epimerase/oxygenase